MNEASPEFLLERAQRCQQAGDAAQAAALYHQLLALRPDLADVHHQLGLLLAQSGDCLSALASLNEALRLDPSQAAYWVNYGVALGRLERFREAVVAYRRALALQPQHASAHLNLAEALCALGLNVEALEHYQQALAARPDDARSHFKFGVLLRELGYYPEAITACEQALRLAPDYADAHAQLGAILMQTQQLEAARRHYQLAVSLQPAFVLAWRNLAALHSRFDEVEAARACYDRLIQLAPGRRELWLGRANICSLIPQSREQIAHERAGMAGCLEQLLAEGFRPDVIKCYGLNIQPPLQLAYQGTDDLPLKRLYANFFAASLPQLNPLPHSAGKPHIGFVVTAGDEKVFLRCLMGIVNRLPAKEFDLTVVCNPPLGQILLGPALMPGIRLLLLRSELMAAVAQFRQARFDLLYYWEPGTSSLNYFLPYFRLARVQCNGWGLSSSGIDNMDVFLSMAHAETAESDAFYTEALVRLPSLSCYYQRPDLPELLKRREDYGLPAQGRLYLWCQNLRKFHPDDDRLAAEILRQDPAGLLVIVGDRVEALNQRLGLRLRTDYPDLFARVHWLPSLEREDYLNVLQLADVILDPVHFGGGLNTTYEALLCGTPVITLPGQFMRGRVALAAYRQIGLSDCVAADEAEFVRLAVGIAGDPERRSRLSRDLVQASEALFEDAGAVAELRDCFQQLLAAGG
ncbi:MAG: tetratricopeptide repeat protein [Candidatus Sericytochromatia bacterium]